MHENLSDGRVQPILIWPDPVLSARAEPAGYMGGPELRRLAADLLATMYDAGGRGLAAPQIGILRRIFVMDAGWKHGAPDPLVMLDPEIALFSDAEDEAEEACLSIPGQPVAVTRPTGIEILYYDLEGRRISRAMQGIPARIAQHEYDHLEGRLIVDFLP